MSVAGYGYASTADVALTAATAKTVMAVTGVANKLVRLIAFDISFDGVTAGNEGVVVELCQNTQAGAGTNTDRTPIQIRGQTRTADGDIKENYTAEPTVLTPIKTYIVHPQTGISPVFSLSKEPVQIGASGFAIRCTAPNVVNCRVSVEWEES